jgi:arylsulfatase A-like enzyme
LSRLLLKIVALCFFSTLIISCDTSFFSKSSKHNKKQPRLVLLYATCTLNKNYLSPYNPNISFTPNLEKFSKNATVFTKHRTEAGLSGIAFASIFSGNQAIQHGIFTHPTKLDDSVYEITEAFNDNGYDVYFWNNHAMASDDLNYAQGVRPNNITHKTLISGDERFQAILDKLSSDKNYKAFVITNFTITHGPYHSNFLNVFCKDYADECKAALKDITKEEYDKFMEIHTEYDFPLNYDFHSITKQLNFTPEGISEFSRLRELLYESNVNILDRIFGNLIKEIEAAKLMDDAVIAFTADHGETLYNEIAPFKWSHGHVLRSDVLDVPLIIQTPPSTNIRPGYINTVTRSIDVFPTLAALGGLRIPDDKTIMGTDLSEVMMGTKEEPSLLAYSHTGMLPLLMANDSRKYVGNNLAKYYPNADIKLTWVSVREGDMVWKYKNLDGQRFGFEAFNLKIDPDEKNNLFDSENAKHREMADKLKKYKADLVQAYGIWKSVRGHESELSEEEQLERLKSLGYVQ